MGVRIMITCGCGGDEPHYSCELGDDMDELWFDHHRVLGGLGIATLESIGARDDEESNDEFVLVTIDPDEFAAWLDQVSARQPAIRDAFRARGEPGSWDPRELAAVEPLLRELALHCKSEGTQVEACYG
jgi:hypothetical protein